MIIRQAIIKDIPQIQLVRNSVRENMLSNPALVTGMDVEDYIIRRGRGWVSDQDGLITGFSIISVTDANVWALFIHPDFEGKGLGRELHSRMMNWYFLQTDKTIWLSTSPGTQAEKFYRTVGWRECGIYRNGEIRFEMTKEEWVGIFKSKL